MRYLYIGLGGALGALARWWLGTALLPAATFPLGTLIANLSGCLLLGLLFPYTLETALNPDVRLGIVTGFIGAYTTFSTWESGMYGLLAQGHTATGLTYLAVSIVGGLLCTVAGMALAREMVAARKRRGGDDADPGPSRPPASD